MSVEEELKKIYGFLRFLETDVILHNPPVLDRIEKVKLSLENIAAYMSGLADDLEERKKEIANLQDQIKHQEEADAHTSLQPSVETQS